jgi:hypothetical protein
MQHSTIPRWLLTSRLNWRGSCKKCAHLPHKDAFKQQQKEPQTASLGHRTAGSRQWELTLLQLVVYCMSGLLATALKEMVWQGTIS